MIMRFVLLVLVVLGLACPAAAFADGGATFEGTDIVSVPWEGAANSEWAVSFWVYVDLSASGRTVWNRYSAAGASLVSFYFDGARRACTASTVTTWRVCGPAVVPLGWRFVTVAIYKGSESYPHVSILIDGVPVVESAYGVQGTAYASWAVGGGSAPWVSSVDDVRLYNASMYQSAIPVDLYNGGLGTCDVVGAPIVWWRMDDLEGPPEDSSGYGALASLTGSVFPGSGRIDCLHPATATPTPSPSPTISSGGGGTGGGVIMLVTATPVPGSISMETYFTGTETFGIGGGAGVGDIQIGGANPSDYGAQTGFGIAGGVGIFDGTWGVVSNQPLIVRLPSFAVYPVIFGAFALLFGAYYIIARIMAIKPW